MAILHMFETFTELDQTHIKPIISETVRLFTRFNLSFLRLAKLHCISTRKKWDLVLCASNVETQNDL